MAWSGMPVRVRLSDGLGSMRWSMAELPAQLNGEGLDAAATADEHAPLPRLADASAAAPMDRLTFAPGGALSADADCGFAPALHLCSWPPVAAFATVRVRATAG